VDDTTDHEWDDTSYTCCAECDEDGELNHFRSQKIDAPSALQHVLETVVRVYPHLLDEKMLPQDAKMLRRLCEAVSTQQQAANPTATPPKADERKAFNDDPTPGPWTCNDSGMVRGPGERDADGPPFVCDVALDCSMGLSARELANARLIAVAPTMLEALNSLIASVEEDVPLGSVTRHFRDALDDARAAIAQAKGAGQ
jgi:hypothetical protein